MELDLRMRRDLFMHQNFATTAPPHSSFSAYHKNIWMGTDYVEPGKGDRKCVGIFLRFNVQRKRQLIYLQQDLHSCHVSSFPISLDNLREFLKHCYAHTSYKNKLQASIRRSVCMWSWCFRVREVASVVASGKGLWVLYLSLILWWCMFLVTDSTCITRKIY